MRIALTGATGFLGRYILRRLVDNGNVCACWLRASSNLEGIEVDAERVEWITGALGDLNACHALVDGCDVVVHSALHHAGRRFRGGEGNIEEFVQKNIVGTLQLIEAARSARVPRFIFISTCAVHEEILQDRPLDESHPLWPKSHYGAHKAALEKFVHSYGLGMGYDICALRPTGIYGIAQPVQQSKWFPLVQKIVRGESVEVSGGGKEVHAADVAQSVELLLTAPGIAGQAYNCYDRYFSELDVATTANALSGSGATILGEATHPANQIETAKLRALGCSFGGWTLFEQTIGELVDAARARL